MKTKLLHIFLMCILAGISVCQVFASEIELNLHPDEFNSQLNIQWARLIERYLLNFNKQLTDFKESHGIESDIIIDETIQTVQSLVYDMRKIQTDKVEKSHAEGLMRDTIDEIKSINKNLKVYLKNKSLQVKEEANMYQQKITRLTESLQKKLEIFTHTITSKINQNWQVSSKEKKVLNYIDDLEQETIKLKTFKNISFRSKSEIKDYIKGIIINIQKSMAGIKSSF